MVMTHTATLNAASSHKNSEHKTGGFMDMSNRQKEKLVLDESLILDMTQGHEYNKLRNSPSPKHMQRYGRETSNRKGGATTPKRDRSNMDISLDD